MDHSPILLLLIISPTKNPFAYWKLNPVWLNQKLDLWVIGNQIKDFFLWNRGLGSSGLIWDTMKAFVRGILKAAIIKEKEGI